MDNTLPAKAKLYRLLFLEPNEMFRHLVEDNHAGVYIADDQGDLAYVNSAFVRILGYTLKEEILGKNIARELYADPKDRDVFLEAMKKRGFVENFEVRNKRKDGSTVFLSVTSNWVKDESDRVIGVEGIVHDISEKKNIEHVFQDEQDRLKQMLNFEESLSLIHHVGQIGQFTVEQVAGLLNARKCSLMLYDKNKEELKILAAIGLDESTIASTRIKVGEGIAGTVARKREPTLVMNIEYDQQFQRHNRPYYPTRSFMSVPVMFGPELLGVLNVADKLSARGDVFNPEDLKFLCVIARGIGIALENARLYQALEDKTLTEPWSRIKLRA